MPTLHPQGVDEKPRRNLLTHLEGNDYLMVIDNSAMEKFTTCPTSAYNYLVLGREAQARNAALTFGGAVHAGLEKLLLGGEYNEVADAIRQHFLKHPAPPDEYRTEANAIEVLIHYSERAKLPDYEWTILLNESAPIIERGFELPLGVLNVGADITLPCWPEPRRVDNVHVAWSGRMDLLAFAHGRNRVVDHKTTSIAGDQFVQEFQLSNQTQGYVWAAQQIYPEHEVSGFCLNAIHLKRPVKGCGLTERGPRGGDPALNFFRSYFEYSPDRLAQWERNTLAICSDFVHCLVRNHFPMHFKWCFGKYGACPYHVACTVDDTIVRERILTSEAFKKVTWDPTADR